MKNNYLFTAGTAVIVGAAAFFGGVKYQQMRPPSPVDSQSQNGAQRANGQNRSGFRMGGQGFRPVFGEVVSKDDKSVTLKLQDQSSKIVMFNDKTTVSKSSEGSSSDIKTGDKIMVMGSNNSDGSVTAQNIQLNPPMRSSASPSPQASPQSK